MSGIKSFITTSSKAPKLKPLPLGSAAAPARVGRVFRDEEENNGLEWPVIPHESKEWVGAAYSSSGNYQYRPSESGYSADADKIEATMRTWDGADIPALREAGFDR